MIGPSHSNGILESRRRRARFRAWHRGTREMDMLLGRFADAHVESLSDHDLAGFEALMELPDGDLFAFITGAAAAERDTPLLNAIIAFHAGKHQV